MISVKILDAAAEGLSIDKIISKIRFLQPDIIGSGGQTPISGYSLKIFEKTKKEISKNIYTLAGGPHFTFTDVESLEKCPELDMIVRGEAEYTVLDICKKLEEGKYLHDIKGITYRNSKGKIIRNPPRKQIEALDTLPFPPWELFPTHKYNMFGIKMLSLFTSRGCFFHCRHCITWKIHTGVRLRSVKRIVDEMFFIKQNFNQDTFFFQEDQTFLNRQQLENFLDELESRNARFYWAFETRSDIMYSYRDLWERMKKNGMFLIFIGLESPNDMVKKYYKEEGCSQDQIEKMLHYLEHALDIIIHIYLVIGAPVETEKNIQATVNYAKRLYPKFCSFVITTPLVPFPGTDLFDELKSKNLITTYNWAKYGSFDGMPVFQSQVSPETIAKYCLAAWKNTYMSPIVMAKLFLDLFSKNKFRRQRVRYYLKVAIIFLFKGKLIFDADL